MKCKLHGTVNFSQVTGNFFVYNNNLMSIRKDLVLDLAYFSKRASVLYIKSKFKRSPLLKPLGFFLVI